MNWKLSVQVGDLVRYRYGKNEAGTIIEVGTRDVDIFAKYKVLWFGPERFTDWMSAKGLKVISSASR